MRWPDRLLVLGLFSSTAGTMIGTILWSRDILMTAGFLFTATFVLGAWLYGRGR